jgi:hypothetical protein
MYSLASLYPDHLHWTAVATRRRSRSTPGTIRSPSAS